MVGNEQAVTARPGSRDEWQQGNIFTLRSACFTSYKGGAGTGEQPPVEHRDLKAKEKLVLVSQDCDIVAEDEPYVEAMLVRIKGKPSDRGYLARVGRNSARIFVLDFERGYVADARYRMLIEKPSLSEAERDPWVMTEVTRGDFAIWLARRYDRPAIPDQVHDALVRPIFEEIDWLAREDPRTLAALDRVVRSVRIQLPLRPDPPYALRLILVLSEGGLSSTEGVAVQSTIRAVEKRVRESGVPCTLAVDTYSEGELLHKVVQATVPINLDYVTRGGVEVFRSGRLGAL